MRITCHLELDSLPSHKICRIGYASNSLSFPPSGDLQNTMNELLREFLINARRNVLWYNLIVIII